MCLTAKEQQATATATTSNSVVSQKPEKKNVQIVGVWRWERRAQEGKVDGQKRRQTPTDEQPQQQSPGEDDLPK